MKLKTVFWKLRSRGEDETSNRWIWFYNFSDPFYERYLLSATNDIMEKNGVYFTKQLSHKIAQILLTLTNYCKERLNNSISLSPSLCTKWSILFGQGNLTNTVFNWCQAMFGIVSPGTNKYQLVHRIQSIRTFTNFQYKFVLKYYSIF